MSVPIRVSCETGHPRVDAVWNELRLCWCCPSCDRQWSKRELKRATPKYYWPSTDELVSAVQLFADYGLHFVYSADGPVVYTLRRADFEDAS